MNAGAANSTEAPPVADLRQANIGIENSQRALKAARRHRMASGWNVLYRQSRFDAARMGVLPWLAALVLGSVIALALSFVGIYVFGAGIVFIMLMICISYAVAGIAAFWLLQDRDGETNETRLSKRTESLRHAKAGRSAAEMAVSLEQAAVGRARQKLATIQEMLRSETYRRQVETARLLAIDPGRLYPDEFERFVGDVFRHLGYEINLTGKSGDQGVDVIAQKGPLRIAVQVKRYIGSIGNEAVQQVYAGMAHHRCQRCVVVTTGLCTTSARALAASTGCELIDRDRIAALIRGELGL